MADAQWQRQWQWISDLHEVAAASANLSTDTTTDSQQLSVYYCAEGKGMDAQELCKDTKTRQVTACDYNHMM